MPHIRLQTHDGITCDNCELNPIRGHRYKCINCDDYDLCQICEEFHHDIHDKNHMFLKIRNPASHINFSFVPFPVHGANNPKGRPPRTYIGHVNPPSPQKEPTSQAAASKGLGLQKSDGPVSLSFVDTVNQFGCQLLSLTMSRESSGLSAMNIYQCLMMAAAGSSGDTLAGFAKTLDFGENDVQGAMKNILQLDQFCKSSASDSVELSSASSIWHRKGMALETGWTRSMCWRFQATIAPLDADAINEWVSLKTKGKITNLASREEASQVELKLITALYFKAKWITPFERTATRNELFYSFEKKMCLCSMMRKTEHMLYQEDDVAQMCVLPYRSDESNFGARLFGQSNPNTPRWKSAVILPKTHGLEALSAIVSHLSSASALRTVLESKDVRSQRVSLSLPRFTLRSSLELSQQLSDQGMGRAFELSMDFSPISKSGPLAISKIQHDVFVDVNEEGTEVAATTVVTMFGGSPPEEKPPVEMKVNRPFVFLVFDDVTKLVLCMAVVNEVTPAESGGG